MTNAAYIAAMERICYSLLLNHLQNKGSPFCHCTNKHRHRTCHKFGCLFLHLIMVNRCELGTGLVLEHRTCTNLSCRGSLHREWRHMPPSTPPATFLQGMLSCPQIYLPHRMHVQSLVCFTHVHTSLQQIYISASFSSTHV